MNLPNTHSDLPTYIYEPSITPTSSSIGGISPVKPPICSKCHSSLYLLLTLDASFGKLHRILYVYGCNKDACIQKLFHDGLSFGSGVFCCRREQTIIQKQGDDTTTTNNNYKNDDIIDWEEEEDINMKELEFMLKEIQSSSKIQIPKINSNKQKHYPHFQHHYLTHYEEPPNDNPDHEKGDQIGNIWAKKSDSEIHEMIQSYLQSEKDEFIHDAIVNKSHINSDEQYEYVNNDEFNNYMDHISLFPKQVVRYIYGGIPLWSIKTPDLNIPCCECGSRRIFECQILPTVLDMLHVDKFNLNEDNDNNNNNILLSGGSMNWGNLAIYSCEKSCNNVKEELVVAQDAVERIKRSERSK